jgi:RimJ/RimL family protein N-acetyltransferase
MLADAPSVQRLAGDRVVADTTERIPHPYEEGMAEAWIAGHEEQFSNRQECTFAMVLKEKPLLIGCISLSLDMAHQRAELGCWIGRDFWGQGFFTEAARELVNYGFTALDLHRIQASHLSRNPASGRVMQKIGMTHEGRLRDYVRKWGVFEDTDLYGMVR